MKSKATKPRKQTAKLKSEPDPISTTDPILIDNKEENIMGLSVNDTVTVTLLATLAGAAGTFEGIPTIVVEPAGLVSDFTVAGDNLSATATVLAAGAFTLTATVDNIEGAEVGALAGTVTGEFLAAAPVVLADTLNVTVA